MNVSATQATTRASGPKLIETLGSCGSCRSSEKEDGIPEASWLERLAISQTSGFD